MCAESTKVVEKGADELFKEFKEVSITEFFRKNKSHLGYSGKIRSLTTVVHELVTNSLDACEEAGILPEIHLHIKQVGNEHYRFISRDNGPGIPPEHISNVFGKMLAGTKFHRSIQLRGQQGIGIAGVTLFSQMTTGKPMKIRTSVGKGKVTEVTLMIDIVKNKADIHETKEYSDSWRGTEIEGELKGVKFQLGEHGPFEYLRRTAIANPHLQILFMDPEGRKTVFKRSSDKIPNPPETMKPHPKGLEVDELVNRAKTTIARRVSSFLSTEFSRVSNAKVEELQGMVNFDLKKNPRRLTWNDAEEIVKAFNEMDFMAPPTEGLRPIGEDQIRKAVLNILKPEFESVLTRNPTVYSGGVPFQVEVAVAYGGEAGKTTSSNSNSDDEGDYSNTKVEMMRFANRTPLLFDAGRCVITKAVNSVDWRRYGIRDLDSVPLTVFVNLISSHVPYTSAGKQSVADESEIVKEIRMALMDVGRKFQRYHSSKRREIEREAKLNALLKYSGELAEALAKLTNKEKDKIQENLEKLIRKRLKMEDSKDAP